MLNLFLKWKNISIGPFQVFFTEGRGKRRFPAASPVPAEMPKPFDLAFYLLPKQCEKTPKEQEQIVHMEDWAEGLLIKMKAQHMKR